MSISQRSFEVRSLLKVLLKYRLMARLAGVTADVLFCRVAGGHVLLLLWFLFGGGRVLLFLRGLLAGIRVWLFLCG